MYCHKALNTAPFSFAEMRKHDPIHLPPKPQGHGKSLALEPAGLHDHLHRAAYLSLCPDADPPHNPAGTDRDLRVFIHPAGGDHRAGLRALCREIPSVQPAGVCLEV